jgi:hypothetical protein
MDIPNQVNTLRPIKKKPPFSVGWLVGLKFNQTCCAFTMDKLNGEFLTFRRTTSTFSAADDLEHELEHIYRNDFEEINRQLESDKK